MNNNNEMKTAKERERESVSVKEQEGYLKTLKRYLFKEFRVHLKIIEYIFEIKWIHFEHIGECWFLYVLTLGDCSFRSEITIT